MRQDITWSDILDEIRNPTEDDVEELEEEGLDAPEQQGA